MAAFGDNPAEWNRLDYQILQNGAVCLYFRPEILAEEIAWFETQHYQAYHFDCSAWRSKSVFHDNVRRALGFPDWYGHNLDAFNDSLSDLNIPNVSGAVLVFCRYDLFAAALPDVAWHVLDIIDTNSRRFMLFGRRLVALVQSDDPAIRFEPLGARPVVLNRRELMEKIRRAREQRGLWLPLSS